MKKGNITTTELINQDSVFKDVILASRISKQMDNEINRIARTSKAKKSVIVRTLIKLGIEEFKKLDKWEN
jgi:hypothetical protein